MFEIVRHAHGGDGDPLAVERRIGDLAALQNVGDRVTDRLGDALRAVRGAGVFELRAGHGLPDVRDRGARLSLTRDGRARKRRSSPSRVRRAPRRRGAARRSQRAADLLDVIAFDDVADPHVLVVLERHAAFLAGLDDSDLVLEPLER